MHNTPKKPTTVAERVREIEAVMATGLWVKGKTGKAFAKKWGVTVSTIENYSAEAWRNVCAASDDADSVRPKIAGLLYVAAQRAFDLHKFDSLAKCADTLSKVTGARAAERHEHAVIIAQYEALDSAGKIQYYREAIKEAEAAIAVLEAEGHTVQ